MDISTKSKIITKADKVKLTSRRIAAFQCPKDKTRAYLWCVEVKGLGVIATTGGAKSYIFQAKVNGKSMRLTIGNVDTWNIPAAQVEARRLRTQIDLGNDPRQIRDDKAAENIEKSTILAQRQISESVTLSMAWNEYIAIRKPQWSERHYSDHIADMHPGGAVRSRSRELTIPGTLASLAPIRLVDLTSELLEEWARVEAEKRPTRARLSLRLLKAFLFWCARHPTYKTIVTRESLIK